MWAHSVMVHTSLQASPLSVSMHADRMARFTLVCIRLCSDRVCDSSQEQLCAKQALHESPPAMVPWRHMFARGSAQHSDGGHVAVCYEAYLYDSGECYWDSEPVMEALLAGRKGLRVWAELQKERPHWRDMCHHIGLPWDMAYMPSRRQCQQDPALAVGSFTRGTQMLSTPLL